MFSWFDFNKVLLLKKKSRFWKEKSFSNSKSQIILFTKLVPNPIKYYEFHLKPFPFIFENPNPLQTCPFILPRVRLISLGWVNHNLNS